LGFVSAHLRQATTRCRECGGLSNTRTKAKELIRKTRNESSCAVFSALPNSQHMALPQVPGCVVTAS
jgi:hypothetical protein